MVLNWEVKETKGDKETWKQGIEGPDGSILPFNEENLIATFAALPDLFLDIQVQSSKMKLFMAAEREADAKN